jgi:hypothetical protein
MQNAVRNSAAQTKIVGVDDESFLHFAFHEIGNCLESQCGAAPGCAFRPRTFA